MSTAYLSVGSNLGDRAAYLRFALRKLSEAEKVTPIRGSSIFETAPWGPVEQGNFLNACLEIETELTPIELLELCQSIEAEADRSRELHWGPRTLDIDILLYDDVQMNSERLTLPHPQLTQRQFVLVPLLEMTEELPLLGELAPYLERLGPQGLIVRTEEGWQD